MLNVGMKGRQFVNVVTENCRGGLYSLRRIKANDLFYGSTEEALLNEAEQGKNALSYPCMKMPEPGITFSQSRRVDFLPFCGRDSTNKSRILCVDTAGQAVLYDADSLTLETLPCLHEPKGSSPMAFSVMRPDAHDPTRPDALYVMDNSNGYTFEALIYGDPATYLLHPRPDKFVWRWHQLPPPPFAKEPSRGSIVSYVLLDDNRICISNANDKVGTYYFNTVGEQWTKAGSWLMPFYGRAQLVPELNNLCFGIGDMSPNHFCAMALSSTRKRRRYHWPDMDKPAGWIMTDGSMAYMGAGRFCIAKTFHTGSQNIGDRGFVTLLSGVEVVHKNGATSELQIIRHKSNRYSLVEHGIRCVL